jgi:hypothetical protein
VTRHLLNYLFWFSLVLVLPAIHHRPEPFEYKASASGTAWEKVKYYLPRAKQFDLVFVGDSRTLCAFDTALYDGMLGTHSINLATWAHWFPTQYPQFQDIVDAIPKGATLVWSIGYVNFRQIHEQVNQQYPLGARNALRYLRLGYSWHGIEDNLLSFGVRYSAAGYVPGLRAFAMRGSWHARTEDFFSRRIIGKAAPPPPKAYSPERLAVNAKRAADAIALYRSLPDTEDIDPNKVGPLVTSITIVKKGGSSTRVELEPEFFREKQREAAASDKPVPDQPFEAQREYWNTFGAILDLFASRGVHLVVNEIEEAPYHYKDPKARAYYRDFMKKVKAEVLRRGIPYTHADFDALSDADYFDYNHLNSIGISKYARLVAPLIEPWLSDSKRAVQ